MPSADSIDLIKTTIPMVISFISGGGLTAYLSYIKDKEVLRTTTQQSLINELNGILAEERKRCDEQMTILHGRIQSLEDRLFSMQSNQSAIK